MIENLILTLFQTPELASPKLGKINTMRLSYLPLKALILTGLWRQVFISLNHKLISLHYFVAAVKNVKQTTNYALTILEPYVVFKI